MLLSYASNPTYIQYPDYALIQSSMQDIPNKKAKSADKPGSV
jgi:hypothetical protein